MDIRRTEIGSYTYSVPFFTTTVDFQKVSYHFLTDIAYMDISPTQFAAFEFGYNMKSGSMSNTYYYSQSLNSFWFADSFSVDGYGLVFGYQRTDTSDLVRVTATGTRGMSWYVNGPTDEVTWDSVTTSWNSMRISSTVGDNDNVYYSFGGVRQGKGYIIYKDTVKVTQLGVESLEANGRTAYFGDHEPYQYFTTNSKWVTASYGAPFESTSYVNTYTNYSSSSSSINTLSANISSSTGTITSSGLTSSTVDNTYMSSTLYTSATSVYNATSRTGKTVTSSYYTKSDISISQTVLEGFSSSSKTTSTSSRSSSTFSESNSTALYALNNTIYNYSTDYTVNTDMLNPSYEYTNTYTLYTTSTFEEYGSRTLTLSASSSDVLSTKQNGFLVNVGLGYSLIDVTSTSTVMLETTLETSYNSTDSSETLRTSREVTILNASTNGFYVTETVGIGEYYEPVKTIWGSISVSTIERTIGEDVLFDSDSVQTSFSSSYTYDGLVRMDGKRTYIDSYTSTVTTTEYWDAPKGYLFSNTTYSTVDGNSTTELEFRSYFHVYDSGTRNVFTLGNTARKYDDQKTYLTRYNLSIAPGTLTDAFLHFDTESNKIVYSESSESLGTVTNYERAATFWYVKPDMDFTYTRDAVNVTWTSDRYYGTSSTLESTTGVINKDKGLCVLNNSEELSSWTETINTKTFLTSYVTSTINPVIGGGDPSKYTTISETFKFGVYSQDDISIYSDDIIYTMYRANTTASNYDWFSTYTYFTQKTYNMGEATTWYSTLTSAVWDVVVTTTKSVGTFTWDYTTKEHWWINETKSVNLRTTSTSTTTRASTTTTGNQVINSYTSDTYINSYTTSYTGVSWLDKLYYGQTLKFAETFYKAFYSKTKYNDIYITADLPLIYQSVTASETVASQSADYLTDNNGMTNRITRSVSVIITSDNPIEYTYLSVSSNSPITSFNKDLTTTKRDTSFFLTSHIEVYTVLGSQGWFNQGFRTMGNVHYVPAINDFSELTNFSGLRKNTDYCYYTWSRARIYGEETYTMSYRNSSSIDCDYYSFWAGTKIDYNVSAYEITSYGNIDLLNGNYNSEARLLVGTSYGADNNVWTVSHFSSAESQWDNYTDGQPYVRNSSTLKKPVLLETFTWSNPRMFDVESYVLIDSAQETMYLSENAFGTTLINGTFYTASDEYNTRTFAQGTSFETQLYNVGDNYILSTYTDLASRTFVSVFTVEPVFNTVTTEYASWNGISYTANYISSYNIRNNTYTMANESKYNYTSYLFSSTVDTYYITSIYSEGYTLDKAGSYTTEGYSESSYVSTREYYLSARQGYSTIGIPYGTFSSTARNKIVKILTSSIGWEEVTYYDTYYKQTVKALADIKDLYTTYTTTSLFGVDEVYREPEYITGISTYSSISGKKGKTKYRSTYVSNGRTLTKGIGY